MLDVILIKNSFNDRHFINLQCTIIKNKNKNKYIHKYKQQYIEYKYKYKYKIGI